MASELQLAHTTTAQTLYAIIRNAVGQVWQTTNSTFTAYVTANLSNYTIALTEQGTASRYYAGTFPAAAAGVYNVTVFVRAGGSAAEGDAVAGAGAIEWDGAAVIPLSTITGYIDTEVAAIKAKTDNLPTDPADASDIAAAFSTVNGTLATIASYIDTEVAAIKAKTDNLPAAPASTTNITAGTITTVTNLTNAPTSGDLTATMKTSAATAADLAITANALLNLMATYIDTEVAAIKAKTDQLVFTVVNKVDSNVIVKTGFGLASDGLDSVTVEAGLNARQALSIIASALAGVLSGAATTTITIQAAGVPGTTRITATVDSDGNRSTLTLVPPA